MGGVDDDEPPSKRMKLSSGELRGLSNGSSLTEPVDGSLRDSMACSLPSEENEEMVGSRGIIKRVEFVRIIAKALYSLGYTKSGAHLEEESGIPLHSSVVSLFMNQILDGNWDESMLTLHKIGLPDENIVKSASFLILEQKFFELLDGERVMEALKTLRTEIVPLCINSSKVCELSSCIVSPSQSALVGCHSQGAVRAKSRSKLLEELQKLLPPTVMIPERRLEHLVEQALDLQRDACMFHNSLEGEMSLYTDHQCGKDKIPSRTLQILHESEFFYILPGESGLKKMTLTMNPNNVAWQLKEPNMLDESWKMGGLIRWCVMRTKGGCFLRLGVVDLEKKSFNIFISKGRGVKGGWSSMAETLWSLGVATGRRESQQDEAMLLKPILGKTFTEVVQLPRSKGKVVVRVEVREEDLSINLNKLVHCLVGFWNPSSARGDDLKSWGTQMAKIWGLKGKLGLAKLERGKFLLEFELLAEAKKALNYGKILVGGLLLRLEKWSPETGCLVEGEKRNEAWVRIVGLPVSLWDRDILRRVGEECGGFLAVDNQTEKLEELQWASILVKLNGEELPNVVEIWVEEVNVNGGVSLKHKLSGHQKPVSHVSWSPDDRQLLTCGVEEAVRCWDVSSGECLRIYEKAGVGLVSCGWSPDGKWVFAGITDRSICMWDLDGKELECWKGQRTLQISDLEIASNGNQIMSICKDTAILLFDREAKAEKFIEEDHTITSFSLSRDCRFLLVNLLNQEIHLWNIEGEAKFIAKYKGHKRERFIIRSCFGGFEEAFIASGSEDSQVYIWHKSSGELIEVLPGHSGSVNCVSWNPANPHMLASASDDRTIRIWGLNKINMKRKGTHPNGTHYCNGGT
uniref:CTLH domain-containing protein n=1 Tax=Vitis vinifera TaxID=29760 RepID=F6H572_VITVI